MGSPKLSYWIFSSLATHGSCRDGCTRCGVSVTHSTWCCAGMGRHRELCVTPWGLCACFCMGRVEGQHLCSHALHCSVLRAQVLPRAALGHLCSGSAWKAELGQWHMCRVGAGARTLALTTNQAWAQHLLKTKALPGLFRVWDGGCSGRRAQAKAAPSERRLPDQHLSQLCREQFGLFCPPPHFFLSIFVPGFASVPHPVPTLCCRSEASGAASKAPFITACSPGTGSRRSID